MRLRRGRKRDLSKALAVAKVIALKPGEAEILGVGAACAQLGIWALTFQAFHEARKAQLCSGEEIMLGLGKLKAGGLSREHH